MINQWKCSTIAREILNQLSTTFFYPRKQRCYRDGNVSLLVGRLTTLLFSEIPFTTIECIAKHFVRHLRSPEAEST